MLYRKIRYRRIRHLPATPFIWLAVIFIFLLDLWIEIYHRIAFPLYHMPYVKRKDYIRIDRHKLSYLLPLEKMYCAYCGYVNGVLSMAMKRNI